MAKVTITYACGHEGTIELFGRSADRERKAAWLASDVCPDCAAKARAEKAAQIAAEAEADGLPKLTGSEKQIVWAEQLRQQFFASADRIRFNAITQTEATRDKLSADEIAERNRLIRDWDNGVAYIAANKVQSSWWIDTRHQDVAVTVQTVVEKELPFDVSDSEAQGATIEATLTPENPSHGGIAEITVSEDIISAKYPKDDDFRAVVKSLKFKWDHDHSRWTREINQFSGSAEDRAAELVNHLLRGGFAVLCWDEKVRRKAIDASYALECDRWVSRIVSGDYKDWFSISIPDRNQALFDEARRINGSRIHRSNVIAPAARHTEVFDFAECNGYCISEGAKALVNEFVAMQVNAVKPAACQKAAPTSNRLGEILASSDEIIADLVDD